MRGGCRSDKLVGICPVLWGNNKVDVLRTLLNCIVKTLYWWWLEDSQHGKYTIQEEARVCYQPPLVVHVQPDSKHL